MRTLTGARVLGTGEAITRRDFLDATLLGCGASLLNGLSPARLLGVADDWSGYGGVGDFAACNGNTLEVIEAGHRLRGGAYHPLPAATVDTGETYGCVVVGGGISGLAAALFFRRQAGGEASCLLLDDHPMFGGEAKRNEFEVDGRRLVVHQGSALHFVPEPASALAGFYASIGLPNLKLAYQGWGAPDPEPALGRTPYDTAGLSSGQYGFYFGARFGQQPGTWLIDPLGKRLEGAPLPQATREELYRWFSGTAQGPMPFEAPRFEGDAISRRLDSISLEQHYMERFGLGRETIRTFLSPVSGGGSGLGPDALSAYADYAASFLPSADEDGEGVQMFAGGNAEIARLIAKALIPDAITGASTADGVCRGRVDFTALDRPGAPARIRLRATVVSVRHEGDPGKAGRVEVAYARDGRVHRVRARAVVMAGGCWTTREIVRDLPREHRDAYARFHRSPCLIANVAVRHWRFLYRMGITGCRWFEGVGNYLAVRRSALCGDEPATIGPDSPVVLTLKVLYPNPGLPTEEQGRRGRMELLRAPFSEYEERIRGQLAEMFFRGGFDPRRDIAGLILNRWGHAYLSPQPGFFFGSDGQPAPREVLRRAPFGRIAFANTDLAGIMDHRCSILEARRAVGQILDAATDG
jgi:spermidine dehydrogenase